MTDKSGNPCAVYDFRHSSDKVSKEDIIKWLKGNTKQYCFQLEEGDSGYKHWQGRFSLIKKRTKSALLKVFKDISPFEYLNPTCSQNKGNDFYAMKEDTRIDGPWTDRDEEIYLPRQFRDLKLYSFQKFIINSINFFEPRKLDFIYDPIGNCGKTTVAAICEIMHGGIDIPPINDFNDIMSMVCDECYNITRDPKIILFDLPRAMDKSRLHGIISAFEQIKKGKLFDKRYKYKKWWIDSPRIWVFSNWLIDLRLLSKDRWNLWKITDQKDIIPLTEDFLGAALEKQKNPEIKVYI